MALMIGAGRGLALGENRGTGTPRIDDGRAEHDQAWGPCRRRPAYDACRSLGAWCRRCGQCPSQRHHLESMITWQYAHGPSYTVVPIVIVVTLVFISRGRLGAGEEQKNLMPVRPRWPPHTATTEPSVACLHLLKMSVIGNIRSVRMKAPRDVPASYGMSV